MHTHACIILPSFHVCDPYTDQKLLCHYVNRWLSNILYPNRWFYKKKNFFHAAYSVKLMKHSQGPCGLGISKQQRVGESSHPGHFSGSVQFSSVQLNSVAQSCPTLCNPMDCITTGLPVHHQLLELAQTCVHQVGDAIQPSHPLSSPSPPAFDLSQHQDLFQWVSSSHQVAKVLEFQLQHQSFQWTPRTDLL